MSSVVNQPWLALQTRMRWEKAVADQIASTGCESFVPTYRARRRWSDRTKEVVLPLFDGYVFWRSNSDFTSRVTSVPGVIRILSAAGVPLPIDEGEIAGLRRIAATGVRTEPWQFLHAGQRVRIATGCLSGLDGILLHLQGQRRIVVSVTLLQRSVAVELDSDTVEPIGT